MLVSQTNPVGIELFSYVYAFFCRNEFTQPLATWVKTLKDASIFFLVPGLLQGIKNSGLVFTSDGVGVGS